MATVEYVEIVHSGEPLSFDLFVERNNILLTETFTISNLYEYQDNKKRIQDNLRPEDKKILNQLGATLNIVSDSYPFIRSGTLIKVPKDNLDKETLATSGNLVIPNEDFEAFLDQKIKDIIQDTNYKPINIDRLENASGKTFKFANQVSVWIWCKALGNLNSGGDLINITPFVIGVTTNVSDNGGNFSIDLAPVLTTFLRKQKAQDRWTLDKAHVQQYSWNGNKSVSVLGSMSKKAGEERLDNNYFFSSVVQSNDVVFIKFETLELEREKREAEIGDLSLDNLIVPFESLVGLNEVQFQTQVVDPATGTTRQVSRKKNERRKQLFDMIGLVDTVTKSESPDAAEVSINVGGRDLMKLLIEDGEYFFPADIAGVSGNIQSDNVEGRALQRLVSGEFNFFNAYVDRTIDFSIRFVFYMLSNIKICSNNLFDAYGEERTFRYEYAKVTENSNSQDLQRVPVEGIWQIIKLTIDQRVANRRLVDSSIVSDQGSLQSFIKGKVCQEPFVEFFGDTYGNQYYLIARKPPFSKESYLSNKRNAITIYPDDVYQQTLNFSDEDVYSWYRLTPAGNFFGDDEDVALAYFPAVFFEEYANIWGSRPYSVNTNYIDFYGIRGGNHSINLDYLVEQARQDLAYVIESHAYLPFSKKGTIVMKGDRRIRRGMCIRLAATKEIYHVDTVSNSFRVSEGGTERVTSINVSRGLVEEYMEGKMETFLTENGDFVTKKVSYFDIIDLKKDNRGISKSTDFKVDKDLFKFFLKRHQFKDL